MDKAKKSVKELTETCVRIQTQIHRFHGHRVSMEDTSGRATRPVTISTADLNLLLFTIKELESLAENVMTRITNVEDIMLTHLDQSLDQPQAPKEGAESNPSSSSSGIAKMDQDELRKLESEIGTGPDRKFRGVIVQSLF